MENDVVEKNKNKNLIIGVMACIIVLLIAALVYFVFIKNDKSRNQTDFKDDSQKENTQSNSIEDKIKLAEYNNDKYKIEVYRLDDQGNQYYIMYNGNLYSADVYESQTENNKSAMDEPEIDENYIVYSFGTSQCYEYNFLVNKKTKHIERFSSTGLRFINNKNIYYFLESNNTECSLEYTDTVYTKNGKKLGIYIGNTIDNNGNIYVTDDTYSKIIKYDVNGNKISENSDYDSIGRAIFFENKIYVVAKKENKVYFVDLFNDNKIEMMTDKNYGPGEFLVGINIYIYADFINIQIPDEYGEFNNFHYDQNKKEIIKDNND